MGDLALRILVVSIIAGAAVIAALNSRRGRSSRRRSFEPRGLGSGLHLFTSAACVSCDRARAALVEYGQAFEEHTYEQNAVVLRENGIERVPAVAFIPGGDDAAWIAEGVPRRRTIERWLGP